MGDQRADARAPALGWWKAKGVGVSSSGKTRAFGARIRRFESSHPSQFFIASSGVRVSNIEQRITNSEIHLLGFGDAIFDIRHFLRSIPESGWPIEGPRIVRT